MNPHDPLMRLAASTAEAIAKALDAICPGEVERGEVAVVPGDASPFAQIETPVVAVGVAYVDGVTGGNVLLLTPAGARKLAAAMSGGVAPAAGDDAEPTELELSAVAEAANQMMAAAASATSVVVGQDVQIAPPEARLLRTPAEAQEAYEATPHAAQATFRVLGEPCRLVQLVPNAFVVRMVRALDEMGVEHVSGTGPHAAATGEGATAESGLSLGEALRDIRVRVWAELGRASVPLAQAPALPPGAVLELDRKAEDPVDLYVNGVRFGRGRLVETDDGEWGLRLIEVAGREAPAHEPEGMVA